MRYRHACACGLSARVRIRKMRSEDVTEIIECLPKGRTIYPYHKDRYAVQLLEYAVGDELRVSSLRGTKFGKLLDRPVVQDVVARCGSGVISRDDLAASWSPETESYRLTLGTWGPQDNRNWDRYWHQTTRKGQNLVLQLNFSNRHNSAYQRQLRCGKQSLFNYSGHPVAQSKNHTLAWARLDIDLDRGEVLIEELQSDWVRFAARAKAEAELILRGSGGRRKNVMFDFGGAQLDAVATCRYYDETVKPYAEQWDEAMLSAVIWFLVEEIGIRRIYLHDWDSGARLKSIEGTRPPRSLYTQLPKRFCFDKVETGPELVFEDPDRRLRRLARGKDLKFWRLYV